MPEWIDGGLVFPRLEGRSPSAVKAAFRQALCLAQHFSVCLKKNLASKTRPSSIP